MGPGEAQRGQAEKASQDSGHVVWPQVRRRGLLPAGGADRPLGGLPQEGAFQLDLGRQVRCAPVELWEKMLRGQQEQRCGEGGSIQDEGERIHSQAPRILYPGNRGCGKGVAGGTESGWRGPN